MEDLGALTQVGAALFDHDIKTDMAEEFLKDPRHHLMLAFAEDNIIGMASGFHYVHPDKEAELFINEVGVLPSFQNMGIGRKILKALVDHSKTLGCKRGAWVLTDSGNSAAKKAYEAAGGRLDEGDILMYNFD
ncbi:GNAT family N-acetyltransferase [Poritiphilus flavus]|uniref:GNAT family N-acetyltransferase n=1 Tax=Poritiphilus flavus TaxID=2697053 RepID=UPI00293B97F7|nr:GNAT family N-acetyltransferase [Poritiphilus flavus]